MLLKILSGGFNKNRVENLVERVDIQEFEKKIEEVYNSKKVDVAISFLDSLASNQILGAIEYIVSLHNIDVSRPTQEGKLVFSFGVTVLKQFFQNKRFDQDAFISEEFKISHFFASVKNFESTFHDKAMLVAFFADQILRPQNLLTYSAIRELTNPLFQFFYSNQTHLADTYVKSLYTLVLDSVSGDKSKVKSDLGLEVLNSKLDFVHKIEIINFLNQELPSLARRSVFQKLLNMYLKNCQESPHCTTTNLDSSRLSHQLYAFRLLDDQFNVSKVVVDYLPQKDRDFYIKVSETDLSNVRMLRHHFLEMLGLGTNNQLKLLTVLYNTSVSEHSTNAIWITDEQNSINNETVLLANARKELCKLLESKKSLLHK